MKVLDAMGRLLVLAPFLAAVAGRAAVPAAGTSAHAKYVFLFIGDGMAMPQISSAEVFAQARTSKDITARKLGFSQFPVAGFTTTYDAGSFITDSASAGTALATGNKTLNGVINQDPTKTRTFKTIAEFAHEKGMKVGIVTTVSLDHATPACFYAKSPSRGNYYEIAAQLPRSGFEYFGGGGFLQPRGKHKDQADIVQLAQAAGYTYVNDKAAFESLRPGCGKVLAVNQTLQDSCSMPYELDRLPDDLSLADYTRKGIELLSGNPKGFFMMVEGGKIDWACHANDAASSIRDTLALDRAVCQAVAFAGRHPKDTLIVVTGDHETGGMTLGFAGTQYSTFFDKIAPQTMSFQRFNDQVVAPYKKSAARDKARLEDLGASLKDGFGLDLAKLTPFQREQLEVAFRRTLGDETVRPVLEDPYLLYGGYEPLTIKVTQLVNQTAGIGWTSYAHTGVPVATFAKGVGQEQFGGYYDNTDIFRKLAAVMLLQVPAAAVR
jgi:alkaline phosphatase